MIFPRRALEPGRVRRIFVTPLIVAFLSALSGCDSKSSSSTSPENPGDSSRESTFYPDRTGRETERTAGSPTRTKRAELDSQTAGSSEEPDELPDHVIDSWLNRAGRNPGPTVAEILALEDAAERTELLEWVVSAWTVEDRTDALKWTAAAIKDLNQERGNELLRVLLESWGAESPLDALKWVRADLPVTYCEAGERLIAEVWAGRDAGEMASWLNEQDLVSLPSFWVSELVDGLTWENPADAFIWTSRLVNQAESAEAREVVLRSWIMSDSEAVELWLIEHPEHEGLVNSLKSEFSEPLLAE